MNNPNRHPFKEGEAWAFGLPSGGYAIVIVARAPRKYPYLLLYGFAPRYSARPSLKDALGLDPDKAVCAARLYTFECEKILSFLPPIHRLGKLPAWNRVAWPVLPSLLFFGNEPHPYLQKYDDDLKPIANVPYPVDQLTGKPYLDDLANMATFVHLLDEYVDHPPDRDAWLAKFERLRRETEELNVQIRERLAAELAREPTRSTIAALTAEHHGVAPEQMRWFDHFIYFAQQRKANQFARRCQRAGYRVERVEPSELEWSVWVRTKHTLEKVDEAAEQLQALAREYGGEYDGWGVAVNQPEVD